MLFCLLIWCQDPGPDIQGHRGARGLLPENTWPAFALALRLGVTTLELDTNLTADDQLIVCHDTELNTALCRNPDGSAVTRQPIRALELAMLTELDCGSVPNPRFPAQEVSPGASMPSLRGLLEKVAAYEAEHARTPVAFNIEFKVPENFPDRDLATAADEMIGAVSEAGIGPRTTIQSFDPRFLELVRARAPHLKRAMLLGTDHTPTSMLALARRVGAAVISPHHDHVDTDLVRLCDEAGFALIPWTVNDRDRMRALIELGVDGIITDYPDRLLALTVGVER